MNEVWSLSSGFYSLRLQAEAQETVIADGGMLMELWAHRGPDLGRDGWC